MNVEVLVATVNADVLELIKKMNIQTNAIIVNQCDEYSYEEIKYNGKLIKVYNFKERGVGLSRNNSLMRATADIVLFADDDEVLVDNYEKIIIGEFEKNKTVDMFVFNIDADSKERKIYKIKKNKRIHKYNSLRYGAVRFAVKLKSVRRENILFSLLFGGGCKYGSGEDSIFIYDCLKNKLKVYSSPEVIAEVDMSSSTWFKGYNEKFFYDKGALFYCLHGNIAILFMVIFLIRHKNYGELSFFKCLFQMIKGYKSIRKGDL